MGDVERGGAGGDDEGRDVGGVGVGGGDLGVRLMVMDRDLSGTCGREMDCYRKVLAGIGRGKILRCCGWIGCLGVYYHWSPLNFFSESLLIYSSLRVLFILCLSSVLMTNFLILLVHGVSIYLEEPMLQMLPYAMRN